MASGEWKKREEAITTRPSAATEKLKSSVRIQLVFVITLNKELLISVAGKNCTFPLV